MKRLTMVISLILLLSLFLNACGSLAVQEEALPTEPVVETQPVTEPTEPEPTVADQEDPAADGVLTVLAIGNSFATAWNDELTGMLDSVGIKVKIYSVYYSSCKVRQHWEWLQDGTSNYRLRHHYQKGGWEDFNDSSLEFCLAQENWDVISLQQHFGGAMAFSETECLPYAKYLYDYLKVNFPKSKLIWQETWAGELGNNGIDEARQIKEQGLIKEISAMVVEENGVPMVPSGDAWHIARTEYGYHDMTRDDLYHDGEEGGGQYLNACVWFEALTGQSCIGNEWRPPYYEIPEEKLLQLQEIAHRAWEENTYK